MNLFSLQIYWNCAVDFTTQSSMERLFSFLDVIGGLHPSCSNWYFKGASLKNALTQKVTSVEALTEKVKLGAQLAIGGKPGLILGLWNGKVDQERISLRIIDGWEEGTVKNGLFLQFAPLNEESSDSFKRSFFTQLIIDALPIWSPYWASILPFGYEGNQSFDKRRHGVGWIAFTRHMVPSYLLEVIESIQVSALPQNAGTIIISTNEIFSSLKPEHIRKSNEIEKILGDLGLLPTL